MYYISNIKHNVLIKPDLPQIQNARYAEGATIIRHREYLGPIITSDVAGAFKINNYPLNPAQSTTFPWASQIASNYEEYRPNGLMFEFRSTASDAIASSTNLALGQVMMCTQYDPTDPEFLTDVQMLNYSWAQSGKVSDCVQHFVECDPKQSPLTHLYTREGATSSDSDLRFSDFGRFSIATSGLQGTSVQIGQLWVTYEFLMYKPKLGSQSAEAGGWFHYNSDIGVSATQPAGTIADGIYDDENNLGLVLSDNVNYCNITFPIQNAPSTYMVVITYVGGSAASVSAPSFSPTTDPNIQFVQHRDQNTSAIITEPPSSITTTSCTVVTWISIAVSQTAPVLIWGAGGSLPTSPRMDLYVCQVPYLDPDIYG